MSYYGMGDYYMAGDPGLFSTIGGLIRRGLGRAVGTLPVVGPAISIGREIIGRGGGGGPGPIRIVRPAGGPAAVPMMGAAPRRRRRMNYANGKALKKAIRRQDGFVKLARKALKGSGYTIVSKSSRARQRPLTIRESGPGSVSVR